MPHPEGHANGFDLGLDQFLSYINMYPILDVLTATGLSNEVLLNQTKP